MHTASRECDMEAEEGALEARVSYGAAKNDDGSKDVSVEDRLDFTSPHFDALLALQSDIDDPLLK